MCKFINYFKISKKSNVPKEYIHSFSDMRNDDLSLKEKILDQCSDDEIFDLREDIQKNISFHKTISVFVSCLTILFSIFLSSITFLSHPTTFLGLLHEIFKSSDSIITFCPILFFLVYFIIEKTSCKNIYNYKLLSILNCYTKCGTITFESHAVTINNKFGSIKNTVNNKFQNKSIDSDLKFLIQKGTIDELAKRLNFISLREVGECINEINFLIAKNDSNPIIYSLISTILALVFKSLNPFDFPQRYYLFCIIIIFTIIDVFILRKYTEKNKIYLKKLDLLTRNIELRI